MKSEDTENSPSGALSSRGDGNDARPTRSPRAEVWLAGSAIVLTIGLVLAGTVSRTGGGVIVIASWAIFVLGLHRYGRTGRD